LAGLKPGYETRKKQYRRRPVVQTLVQLVYKVQENS
jgi:hypothetical protein